MLRQINEAFDKKYQHLQEADKDYVKIGNMVLPTNAASFGNADIDTVSRITTRKYNAEKEAEAEAQRRAELEKQAATIIAEVQKALETTDDRLDALFQVLVPRQGKAPTAAGELVRAWMRVEYRDYNDGDVFYDGYGLETCGPAAAFVYETLEEEAPNICKKIDNIASNGLTDSDYTNAVTQVGEMLVDYILNNAHLLATPNESDMLDWDASYWEDISPKYEYEADFSGDIEEYIDHDKISWDDVEEWLSNLLSDLGISSRKINRWALDAFTITDLGASEKHQEIGRAHV